MAAPPTTSIKDQLAHWATRNTELIKVLGETDYAPTALDQQNEYLSELQREALKVDQEIGAAVKKREREHKDHKKYDESIFKRFSYKAVGKREKYEAKAQKEEREYFDALQDEHAAKDRKRYLDQQLSEAQSAKTDLERIAAQNKKAQEDLDGLYNMIFNGPTPELPQEDESEFKASHALSQYQGTRSKWECEDQAFRALNDANKTMSQALAAIDSALSYSTWDMWGGGTMSDMMERNELSRAQSLISTVYMLFSQAQRFSPQCANMPAMNIDQGHMMSDVFFDNIFTDMAQHDRIKESQAEMMRGAQHLKQESQNCRGRVDSLRDQLKQEEKTLLAAREELQKVRQQAFQDLAQPPAYSED